MSERELRVSVRACEHWLEADGVHLRLRVANEDERTLFVSRSVRQLEVDPAAGRLTVWLSDHGRDVTRALGRCGSQAIPSTAALAPGDEVEITAVIPPVVHRVRFEGETNGEPGVVIDELPTLGVSHVVVHAAVAEAPFYYSPKGESIVRQLKAWGRPLRMEARRITPSQGPAHGP